MDLDLSPLADRALEFIAPGATVGLGTGRAATAFMQALAAKIGAGFVARGIPTSERTAQTARELGIPLADLNEVSTIDITVDGADEVDDDLNLIKGLGGALLREKIVAAASRELVILVHAEKCVLSLGTKGVLPVEVVPFALPFCRRRLDDLGLPSTARRAEGGLLVTDNGNHVLDCKLTTPPSSAPRLDEQIHAIPGVVATGFFLGMADVVLVQQASGVLVRRRSDLSPLHGLEIPTLGPP